jgi:hypothetical protein
LIDNKEGDSFKKELLQGELNQLNIQTTLLKSNAENAL